MKKTILLIFIFILTANFYAQNKPNLIITSEPVQRVAPLSSRKSLPQPVVKGEVNKKRKTGQNIIVPGKGYPKGVDPLYNIQRNAGTHPNRSPLLTFQAANQGATPSDPTGAVGPNHYVVAYNSAFKIFDKNGNVLVNDTALHSIFTGTNDDGDPIVLYDRFADRYLITEFDLSSSPNKLMVAVSQGPDPVNSGWYVYRFNVNDMPDYPKYSIWSDGYYITANISNPQSSNVVFALERDKMLNGDTTARIVGFSLPGAANSGFYSPSGFNVLGNQLPPPGNAPIVYLQDDSWAGVSDDHLKIWNINMDWNNITNSTISQPQIITTTDFNSVFDNGSFSNLMQPNGTKIDALQATIMFMTNYRRFANYNSVVLNFVVNSDGNGKAAIRWYELRQDNDGDPWYIYQEGTYADPSGHNTFAGSISMDSQGNIGLGYTIVSATQVPELRFTGRYASDALGQMTLAPDVVTPGVQSDPSTRYGDYSQLTVDPTDDKTFWFIGEYFKNNRRVDQVGVFKIASDFPNDVGVSGLVAPVDGVLSANEPITIEIYNYGTQPQSNFQVQYQVDGGTWVTENFTGTIQPGTTQNFTFATTADLSTVGHTYQIIAKTNLSGDQDNNNDSLVEQVTHLFTKDVGITAITAPVSSSSLTNAETITVTIKNFGADTQSNIPVRYILDGNNPVNETYVGSIASGQEVSFSFVTAGDFSALGNHQLSVATTLSGDQDTSNDEFTTTITKSMCQPQSNCSLGDEIVHLVFANLDNTSSCSGTGYSDFTNMTAQLVQGNTYDMSITTHYGDEHVTAWIDFNDNFVFEDSEKIIVDEVLGAGQGSGNFSGTFNTILPNPMPLGQHLMRVRTNWDAQVPDPCSDVTYGETEDYMVNVVDANGVNEFENSQIVIQNLGENHFMVSMQNPVTDDDLTLTVYNIAGQELVHHYLRNINGQYTYDLNLSYVSKGVYLLRIGNENGGLVKRIIVK